MQHSAAADLGPHCLQRPNCPNSKGCYSTLIFFYFPQKINRFDNPIFWDVNAHM